MFRRSTRLAKDVSPIKWENVLANDDFYDKCDVATQKSIDLLLKSVFIKNGVFTSCEHAVFGEDRYDGILVTTTTDTFCLSGRLLRNIQDPDFIEGCLTKEGIRWTD